MNWALVAVIVAATVAADVLQSYEMKRHGEVCSVRFSTAMSLARRWPLILAVLLMAVSFFAFMTLLSMADLTFAVPATAGTFVIETILARYVLRERVSWKRWSGAVMVACGVALLAI